MAFKGTLKEFKVPDILQLIAMQKKTGILTFNSFDGFVTIVFEDGLIFGVDAFPKKLEMRLGTVLVKQEVISEEMLHRALSIQKRTSQKVGEILSSMGLINEDSIAQALRTQAFQIVFSLFNWKKGEYNFKVMEFLDQSLKTLRPISADTLIMEGVQMLDEWPLIRKVIPQDDIVFEPVILGNKKIEVLTDMQDEPDISQENVLYLMESEINLLKSINGKNTVKDLVEMGLFTEYRVYKNLFNLNRKGLIEKKSLDESSPKLQLEEIGCHREMEPERLHFAIHLAWLAFILLLVLTWFRPFAPINRDGILFSEALKDTFRQPELIQIQSPAPSANE